MSQAATSAPRPAFSILFVEDEFADVAFLQVELSRVLGREVLWKVVGSTGEAEARLRSNEGLPDVIVLDVMLPESAGGKVEMTEGVLFVARLRQTPDQHISRIPVVILTARSIPQLQSLIQNDRRLAWMGKPAHPRKVAAQIAALVTAAKDGAK